MVLARRPTSDDPAAQERAALAEQRAALESLKAQLAERVAAVKEREDELRAAIAKVAAGKQPSVALPPVVDPATDRLATRSAALGERERALAAREAALAAGASAATGANGDAGHAERMAELAARERTLEERLRQLDAREHAVEERERIPRDPDAVRLAEIEARLDELREAEEAFLRTRRELADRSDAVDARERLIAQRERELDEREDGWGSNDMQELESRLRRLELQRAPSERGTFSGGFRKLEQEGTRRPPAR
jgi:DNA repair exonuclease SbcCD ATPase subunit